jgi:hypothetical protein
MGKTNSLGLLADIVMVDALDNVALPNGLTLYGIVASKLLFTDSAKKLTTTGIGTSSQFLKADGSIDSNTYSLSSHNHSGIYEPILGSPSVNGYLLSSTTAGVRSWVAPYSHPSTHPWSIITGTPTALAGYGITDAAPLSHVGATGTAHGVATQSIAGFMSATDKTKLDGLSNYTLSAATSSILGGLKIFSDTVQTVASNAISATTARTYGVQFNSSGQAVVNIPWTDTVYTHPTYTYTTPIANTGTTLSSIPLISTLTQTNGHVTGGTMRKLVSGTNISIVATSDGNITINDTYSYTHPATHPWSILTGTPTTLSGYGITDATPSSHIGATGAAHGNSTTSVAGFMSAADKTKLDGLSNYTLVSATSSILGGVKIFSDTVQSVASNSVTSTDSRTYGIQLNSSGQVVVNIPWTDTVYTHPSVNHIPTGGSTGQILQWTSSGTAQWWTPNYLTSSDLTNVAYKDIDNAFSATQTINSALPVFLRSNSLNGGINRIIRGEGRTIASGYMCAGILLSDGNPSGIGIGDSIDKGSICIDTTNGKLYIAQSTATYPSWSEIAQSSSTLQLGETSSTAYRGDRGKIAYDHSQTAHQSILNGTGFVKVSGTTVSYDNSTYLTGITKAQVEAVLTGTITSHNHDGTYSPASGSANYIQNQNAGAQSANMWISGTAKIGGIVNILGGSTLGLTFRSNVIQTEEYNGTDGITFNYRGYANDVSQFRNVNIYDGKTSPVVKFFGDGKYSAFYGQIQSFVATGTAPFTVASTTSVSNLNADFLDGYHASYFQPLLINPITGTGTANYIPKFTGTGTIGNSQIFDNGTFCGIGYTADPTSGNKLAVNGAAYINGNLTVSRVLSGTGSASEPSISFSGDSDTGLYSYTANQIGFTCGGTNIARFMTTGLHVQNGDITVAGGGVQTDVSVYSPTYETNIGTVSSGVISDDGTIFVINSGSITLPTSANNQFRVIIISNISSSSLTCSSYLGLDGVAKTSIPATTGIMLYCYDYTTQAQWRRVM